MHRGYIKLWRKAEDSGLTRDPITWTVFTAFCLLRATRRPRVVMAWSKSVKLQPGELIGGRNHIADTLGISEKQARRAISVLTEAGIVKTRPGIKRATVGANNGATVGAVGRAKGPTVITICNWEIYQSSDDEAGPRCGPDGDQNEGHGTNFERAAKQEREQEKTLPYQGDVTLGRGILSSLGDIGGEGYDDTDYGLGDVADDSSLARASAAGLGDSP